MAGKGRVRKDPRDIRSGKSFKQVENILAKNGAKPKMDSAKDDGAGNQK